MSESNSPIGGETQPRKFSAPVVEHIPALSPMPDSTSNSRRPSIVKVPESSLSPAVPSPKPASAPASRSAKSTGDMFASTGNMTSRQAAAETRKSVLSYIRNERDTAQVKWMQLTENLSAEDAIRDQFQATRLKNLTRQLPLQVRKLIGNLKRAVHKTMSSVGGTPFSILRQLFIYWDSHKNGSLSFYDFSSALHSLKINIPEQDRRDIFSFYAHSSSENARMGYQELLTDIQKDEPTILDFLGEKVNEHDADEIRFAEEDDKFAERPVKVSLFLDAIRNHIGNVMRSEGGTLGYHVKRAFQNFDFNYSSGLDPHELLAAGRGLFKLNMTLQDAKEIVEYYDRKHSGEMNSNLFIDEICEGQTSMLSFQESTKEAIAAAKHRVASNPFVKRAFKPIPNKLFERVKENIRKTLDIRLNRKGGSYSSWVNEAFAFWDPKGTGKFCEWKTLRGALLRLGVFTTPDEAAAIMACFDEFGNGEIPYRNIVNNILADETNLVVPSRVPNTKTLTERAPKPVLVFTRKIKTAIDIFVRKSKGALVPKDILHGTFLRFDQDQTGRVSKADFIQVAKELGVTLNDNDASVIVQWFDSNGLSTVDYNEVSRQLYGEDVLTRTKDFSRELPKGLGTPAYASSCLEFAQTAFTSSKPKKINSLSSLLNNEKMTVDSILRASEDERMWAMTGKPSTGTNVSHWTTMMKMPLDPDKKLKIETELIKQARNKLRRNLIMSERSKIVSKIESIEQQRKKIIDDHKARVADRLAKQRAEEWERQVGPGTSGPV